MIATRPRMTAEEIGRRGEEWYNAGIRQEVEPEHKGNFLALNIFTGDYEIDAREVSAVSRALARNPDGLLYILRVGYPVAHYIGGGSLED